MRIYLVRHGESQGNVYQKVHSEMADHAIPLSTQGHEQAYAAGQWLANEFSNRLSDNTPHNQTVDQSLQANAGNRRRNRKRNR